jgi:predicted metallopeptidase
MDNPFEHIKKNAFTTTFKNRRPQHRHLRDLHQFAHFIVENPEEFSKLTVKRARFYVNLIERKKKRKLERAGSLPVGTIHKVIKNGYKLTTHEIDDYHLLPESTREVQGYINEQTKRIIINFVGTYSALDWYNNYKYALGKYKTTTRYKRAEKTFNEIIEHHPNYKISIVSHSQGAVPARILGKLKNIFEIIEVNPAYLGEKQLNNEYFVRSSFDPVSLLVRNALTIPKQSFNPLTEHSPDILLRLPKDQEIGR